MIQYTYKNDKKHSAYNNYYDALRVYHKMVQHGIYKDITTNFDIDDSFWTSGIEAYLGSVREILHYQREITAGAH